MKSARTLTLIVITAIAAAAAGLIAARMLSQKPLSLRSGTWLPQARALLPFQSTDLDGRPFGNADLHGHPTLIFLGYTSCPDVCPTTLAILQAVQLRAPLPGLAVVFITVDPERDTPKVLKTYLSAFSNEFIGLHVAGDGLSPLLKTLSAMAIKTNSSGATNSSDATHSSGAAALVDHTATLYLLDRRGRLAAVFTPPLNAANLYADLRMVATSAAL